MKEVTTKLFSLKTEIKGLERLQKALKVAIQPFLRMYGSYQCRQAATETEEAWTVVIYSGFEDGSLLTYPKLK